MQVLEETWMSDLFWLTDDQMERLQPFFRRAMASHALMIVGC